LILKKITNNFFVIALCFIYLSLFGFYQKMIFSIIDINNIVLSSFFFLSIIDFFCYKPNKLNLFLIIILGALIFFYSPMDSSEVFYASFLILIGIFISYYLKIISIYPVLKFWQKLSNYYYLFLFLILAIIIIFPIIDIIFKELPKFNLARNALGYGDTQPRADNVNFLSTIVPIFEQSYSGLFWFLLIISSLFFFKHRLMIIFRSYFFLVLIASFTPVFLNNVSVHILEMTSSNLICNIATFLIPNMRTVSPYETFTRFFHVLFIVLIAGAIKWFLSHKNQKDIMLLKKLSSLFIFVLKF